MHSALGTNGQCAYESAFFADFAPPVRVGNPWLVMGLVADRLRYQWDNNLFGLSDVWQTGPEARCRGDAAGAGGSSERGIERREHGRTSVGTDRARRTQELEGAA